MSDAQDTSDNGTGGMAGGTADVGSGVGTDWRASLPPELGTAPWIRSAPSLEQAVADMQRAAEVTGNSLRIPGPDASEQQRQEFYQRVLEKAPGLMPKPADEASLKLALKALGMPDDPGKYQLPEIEGMEIADERVGELRAMAHQAGLTGKQFEGFMQQMLSQDVQRMADARAAADSDLAQLKGEWGSAHDTRMQQIVQLAASTDAPQDLVEALQSGGINADTLRWFHTLVERMGAPEGGAVADQGKQPAKGPLTPAEAFAQLEEVEAQLVGKFDIPAERKQYLMKRRLELMQAAYS